MGEAVEQIEKRKRPKISEDYKARRCGYAVHVDGTRCGRWVKHRARCQPCELLLTEHRRIVEQWNWEVRRDKLRAGKEEGGR